MGGTDYIENPGPYLHRSSKKAPRMGVLTTPTAFKVPASGVPLPTLPIESRSVSREEAVQAYAARLDALNAVDPEKLEEAEVADLLESKVAEEPEPIPVAALVDTGMGPESEPAASSIAFVPSRSGPFQTIGVPLYPKAPKALEEEPSIRTPRWRGG